MMGCKLPFALLILLFALPNNLNSFPTNASPAPQQDSQPFPSDNSSADEADTSSAATKGRSTGTGPSLRDENPEVEVTSTDFPSSSTQNFQPEDDDNDTRNLKRRGGGDPKEAESKSKTEEKEKASPKDKPKQKEGRSGNKKGNGTQTENAKEEDAHKHKPTGRGLIGKSAKYDFHYLDETDISNPNLTYFILYKADFYPPWTYHGFFPPSKWHEVPIEYFYDFDQNNKNSAIGYAKYKKHKSAMGICSGRVTLDSRKCTRKVENECLNDLPSPINILTKEAKEDRSMKNFAFNYFDTFFGFDMFIPEDGTDLLFLTFLPPKRTMEKRPGVSSGSIGNHELHLDRISFHFGKDQYSGSEHALDGKRYGMEVQLYFTGDKAAYWESISKYKFLKPNDPLMGHNIHVFSVMVSVARPGADKPDDETQQFAERFELLSLAAMMFWPSVNVEKHRVARLTRKLISLEDFLGEPRKGLYYTYEGSLTHPPCLKHAKWTVFESPIWITYEQWLRFATIVSEFSDENFLAGNFRRMSDVLIKTDIPTYLEMRKAEGMRTLAQRELDREIRTKPTNNDSDPELYVIQQYTNFEKYYARKVKKRGPIEDDQDANENDYYDTIGDSGNSHLAPKIVLQIVCLILIKIKLIH